MKISTLHRMAKIIFNRLGVTNVQIGMAQLGIDTIAAAAGITVSLPTWNNVTAIGIIHIKPDYLTFFSDKQWLFIIAHECSHIFYSHSVSTLLWSVLEAFLNGHQQGKTKQ